MSMVRKVRSLISQGIYSVSTPFHPFGGAIDVIVVQQHDGSFRCTPWYVRFGKFQGVLQAVEKEIVKIYVNGIEAGFHMYLDNSGEAYFIKKVVSAETSIRISKTYIRWKKVARFVLGKLVFGLDLDINQDVPKDELVRTNVPTNEQIASLNLKDGQNVITFSFSTRVVGTQEVNAHIYRWRWDTKIVISDVDGTITKSDVLGMLMPLVGKDWTHTGVAKLFSAIEENGYQFLFLSARAIIQASLTRSFLLNLKQDGKALPNGPVVISPEGLLPLLYRSVIRRAPHEFKIACLQDIRKLFPTDYNPFYAGFGDRITDKMSYFELGIPPSKIFIINPKGEVTTRHSTIDDKKSYTSLHTLVNNMFPPINT